MIELRDYQRAAIDTGIYEYFDNNAGNPLIVVPTGGGKSLIIAKFLCEIFEQWPDQRILVLTHVKELIQQNYAELIGIWPNAPAGVNSAGLNKRDFHSSIIFGGIQSLHKYAYNLQRIDLVIVDECHLLSRNSDTMYQRFLGALREINPYIKVVGLTATPFRLDSGMLHEGDDAVFSDISYEISIRDLIDQGFLAPPVTRSAGAQIDTSGVGTRGGEFIPGQLETAASDPETIELICDEIVAAGEDRRGWLVFGCGVNHCKQLRDAIRRRGVICEAIFGDTPDAERDAIILAYKAQKIRSLVSMGVLTTGFNAQHVDLLAIARPTKSTGLYVQIVGRGLRTFEGKKDCLVLDFGGNIARHGPIDEVRVKKPVKGDGDAPHKFCPECGSYNHASAMFCAVCGFEFGREGPKIEFRPSDLHILKRIEPEWVGVDKVFYRTHEKPGKPPSMRVDYNCGMLAYCEWICLEHTGYARTKAVEWWKRRAPEVAVPNTVKEALENVRALKEPTEIKVRLSGKYHEIIGAKL